MSALDGSNPPIGTGENDDEDEQKSSIDNVFPKEKLENGLREARKLWLVGWNGAKKISKDIEQSEQVAKLKEKSAPVVQSAGQVLCGLGEKVGDVTSKGIKWTGEKFEEAKPHLTAAADKTVEVTKQISQRTIEKIEEVRGGGGSNNGSDGDAGPRTV